MNDSFQRYTFYFYPYVLAVSYLYLYGFWETFDINIFSFISVGELIITSLYSLILITIPFLLIHLVQSEIMKDLLPYGGGRNTKEGKFLNRKIVKFILVVLDIALITFLVYWGEERFWMTLIPVLIAVPASTYFTEKTALLEPIKDLNRRSTLIFLIIFIPFQAYGWGKIKGEEAYLGKGIKYELKSIESKLLKDYSDFAYLGKLGDHYFLFNSKKESLSIIPIDNEIILKKVEQ